MDGDVKLLTSQEQAFLDMVRRCLVEARENKTFGEVAFKASLHDGGIRERWYETKVRDK